VPLFKTMELAADNYVEAHKSRWDKAKELGTKLKKAGKFFGLSAIAVLQAFKFKYKVGEFTTEADLDKLVKAYQTTINIDEKPKEKTALQTVESIYFEFEKHLKTYTTGKDSFRLLFLIDDLDRCLPEKAVEMLEAIKLFLDVPGCAFVLALDDEVVERGIIHRYRDYLFQGNNQQNDKKGLAHLPITGMEYLEKIIHLPFRLPLPSENDIREFLRQKYKHTPLFEELSSPEQEHEKLTHEQDRALPQNEDADVLLELFVRHIPPVPRKQIRMAELLLLMKDIADASDCKQRIRLVPLAELTLLQLFAPELYRFGRRKFSGFMLTLKQWADTEQAWGHADFKTVLENRYSISSITGADDKQEKAFTRERHTNKRNFDRIYAPMLDILEEVSHSRSGFKIFDFIKQSSLSQIPVSEMLLYFGFVDEAVLKQKTVSTQAKTRQQYTEAKLSDSEAFLDLLFSTTEGGWQSAVNLSELQGKVLAEPIFEPIHQRLQEGGFDSTLQGKETVWLGLLLPFLKPDQFKRLHTLDVFKHLFPKTKDIEPQLDQLSEQARLIHRMTPEQREVIDAAIEQQRVSSKAYMANQTNDIKERAKAGLLLGWLGDDRKGVAAIKQQEGVIIPDIDWVLIDAQGKSFMMGANNGDKAEKPEHEQTMPANYYLSRYPITNAQYQAFIDAGGYAKDTYWQSDQAKAWKTENNIQYPRYWDEELWNCPNQPVVGISWFEAMAYAKWLNDYQEGVVRLPTEREWEFATRGEQSLIYPWGNDWQKDKANAEQVIGRTSSVGLFNQAKNSPFQLDDMAGNVWEWMVNNHHAYDEKEGYKDWDVDENKDFVLRGGSWYRNDRVCRSSGRLRGDPEVRLNFIGFRLLLSLASDS
jgi:formylglycine-generating enzyme required for sulfatase activity